MKDIQKYLSAWENQDESRLWKIVIGVVCVYAVYRVGYGIGAAVCHLGVI